MSLVLAVFVAVAVSGEVKSDPAGSDSGQAWSPERLANASREDFADYAQRRGEGRETAEARYDLAQRLIGNGDLTGTGAIAAFLEAPRHRFADEPDPDIAYRDRPLPIGHGQTISAPHMVARMTTALEVEAGHRVLEIGTGSGYQAAILTTLTDQVYSIEIVEPLALRTAALYEALIDEGYRPYANVQLRAADGYYGWEEHAPFDRIIVTAAIDHIPPPLLRQLSVGGRMLIPVGPPMAQILLQVDKTVDTDGEVQITRRDVYEGRARVVFVPFTRSPGDE